MNENESGTETTPALDDSDIEAQRRALLTAALPHVAFDGWSWTALRQAASELGLDAMDAENAFPGGATELLALHSREADHAMLAALEAQNLDALRVRDRVALAIRTRLEQNAPHREAIRRGLSVLALPANAALAARLLARTVDAIWAAAGDTSVDHNVYTKRGLLAGVYMATLLYWLEDRSEGHARTWAFLERRLDTALRLGGAVGRRLDRLARLPDRIVRQAPRRRPGLASRFGRGANAGSQP